MQLILSFSLEQSFCGDGDGGIHPIPSLLFCGYWEKKSWICQNESEDLLIFSTFHLLPPKKNRIVTSTFFIQGVFFLCKNKISHKWATRLEIWCNNWIWITIIFRKMDAFFHQYAQKGKETCPNIMTMQKIRFAFLRWQSWLGTPTVSWKLQKNGFKFHY